MITYKQLNELDEILSSSTNEETTLIKIIQLVYGYTEEEIRKLPVDKLTAYIDYVNKYMINLNSEKPLQITLVHNDIEYGFIPNFSKITTGELIDLDTYHSVGDWLSIINILYRPIINKNKIGYEIEDYNGTIDRIDDSINLDIVQGVISFFQKSFQNLN